MATIEVLLSRILKLYYISRTVWKKGNTIFNFFFKIRFIYVEVFYYCPCPCVFSKTFSTALALSVNSSVRLEFIHINAESKLHKCRKIKSSIEFVDQLDQHVLKTTYVTEEKFACHWRNRMNNNGYNRNVKKINYAKFAD